MTPRRAVEITLAGGRSSVRIGAGLLADIGRCVAAAAPGRRALLAADRNLRDTHAPVALASLRRAGIEPEIAYMDATEAAKTLAAVEALYRAMLGAGPGGLDRGCPVVALGGGIVGDTAGFAAATFLRGLPLVQVPTTLLAMVDASIGGKTGVNFPLPGGGLGKNMIGAFWQPAAVLIDPAVLSTLPKRDYRCGLAECVKAAIIADAPLLDFLDDSAAAIDRRDVEVLAALIHRCVRIKAAIVDRDERETGPRALLNLGHTFAHAIEAAGRLDLRHGEAVSIGLVAASRCAVLTGRLTGDEQRRIASVLASFGLPLRLPSPVSTRELSRAMQFDKKASGGTLRLVLPRGLGAAEVTADVPPEAVAAAWAEVGAAPG